MPHDTDYQVSRAPSFLAYVAFLSLNILLALVYLACSSSVPVSESASTVANEQKDNLTEQVVVVDREEQYVLQNLPEMTIDVTSGAVNPRGIFNKYYTCDGIDVSPSLSWSGAPSETKNYVVLMEDPNSEEIEGEGGGMWSHWILYSISPEITSLPENLPQTETLEIGAKHGLNDYEKKSYSGPCPRPTLYVTRPCPTGGDGSGSGCGNDKIHSAQNRPYYFHVYAIDKEIYLPPGVVRNDILQEIEGHILATGTLSGKYRTKRQITGYDIQAITKGTGKARTSGK